MTDLLALARACGADVYASEKVEIAEIDFTVPQLAAFAARIAKGPTMTIDIERMLRDCVPGGSVCDPQQVADDIREWFAAQPVGAEPPGCPTPGACSCPAAVAQVVVENQMPRDLDELNRWINVANARGFAKGIEVRPCLESARKVLAQPAAAPQYHDSAPPIWETLAEIGREVSENADAQPAAGAPDARAVLAEMVEWWKYPFLHPVEPILEAARKVLLADKGQS